MDLTEKNISQQGVKFESKENEGKKLCEYSPAERGGHGLDDGEPGEEGPARQCRSEKPSMTSQFCDVIICQIGHCGK
jgi:hypothetical protein